MFQPGVQSLYTTLERLGIQNPEEEMRLIEQEAERFPWLRQGMIALIKEQLAAGQDASGGGGGAAPSSMAGALGILGGGGGGQSGALNFDALSGALGKAVPGSPNGGA